MNISNLEEKKNLLLNKYRDLFIQKTGFTGGLLNNYVSNLIVFGEKYYGTNFTEDILKEKRQDSILWLMDEVSRHGGMVVSNNILSSQKEAVSNLVDTINGDIPKGLPEVDNTQEILNLIDKMDEYEFENYLKQLTFSSENMKKFNYIASNLKQGNPNLNDFQASKQALGYLTNDIKLVYPSVNNTEKNTPQLENNNIQSIGNVNAMTITEPIDVKPVDIPLEKDITKDISVTARIGRRKAAPKTLVDKFKEKWKNTSFKKKLLIGAIAIVGVGIITATVVSQMIATQSMDVQMISNAGNLVSDMINNGDVNSVVSWDGIGQGTEVHQTMNDALNGTNNLTSNEWMNIDHMEAVNKAGDVVNLDGMTVNEVNQTLDAGDYGIRGSSNGNYMGWFDENTVKEAINQGKGL